MATFSPKIDILPEHLIDQIKAGEVIERPGNLIKEILENAIDAGATKLELLVQNNGLDMISLKDNGHGMKLNDLPLAFSRHATSKISRFEDLYKLHSYGFRGEALASIASIAKLHCISKTHDGDKTSEIKIEGGETIYHGERQSNSYTSGTELVIQTLFFNTPARLKFIQSQQSEKQFIKKIVFAFILNHPMIEFHVKIDDGDKEIFLPRDSHQGRIHDIFPKAQDALLHSERFYENNELNLFLVPSHYKTPVKIQNIYINNRFILDKQLHRVMSQGIDSVFGDQDFHYIAYFNLPPDTIDANVHPNKTIIKCLEISKMISLLTSTIKDLAVKNPKSVSIGPAQFFGEVNLDQTLQQERHEYNMEGLFSPHRLPLNDEKDFFWVGHFFLRKMASSWYAISARKLLEMYCKDKLTKPALTIPLLVSEPFPSKSMKESSLKLLQDGGAEIDYLGKDTLVMRGIPEWMNGFPLKEIVQFLLQNKNFSEMEIHHNEWSRSTWEEMVDFFGMEVLIKEQIATDLEASLRETLK